MLDMDTNLITLARKHRVWRIRADGVDPATVRTPRDATTSNAFDTLTRPALHVYGGHGVKDSPIILQ